MAAWSGEGAGRLLAAAGEGFEDRPLSELLREAPSLVIPLLLEDGDCADLGRLSALLGEASLARWVVEHGARRLSRRSLAFWEVVLAVSAVRRPEAEALRELLWPL